MKKEKQVYTDVIWRVWRHLCVCALIDHGQQPMKMHTEVDQPWASVTLVTTGNKEQRDKSLRKGSNSGSTRVFLALKRDWEEKVFFVLVLVVTRIRSSTLPHLFPDLNPISLFGTILHALPPTSFTAFLAVNVANFTLVKRADVYLTDMLNTLMFTSLLRDILMLLTTLFPI